MVISAVGMAICLLCGSCGGKEESRGALEMERTAGRKAEEASRQVWEEQEERKQQEAQERAARLESYRTCSSGTRIEDVLSEEETDSLFYASEIPAEVFRRMVEEQARLEGELEEKMDRWVYLSDLAEQIEEQNQK